ncbi:AMP-binding protein, partial [Klebsiella pneumoniae]|nr:AMP-binding protein [Klebsiella pneumoniae]
FLSHAPQTGASSSPTGSVLQTLSSLLRRASLRLLGSVGEPINPEAWRWYHEIVGEGRCPIVDTWWQTETGGHMITPLPGATPLKPGAASVPFFGVEPALVDAA